MLCCQCRYSTIFFTTASLRLHYGYRFTPNPGTGTGTGTVLEQEWEWEWEWKIFEIQEAMMAVYFTPELLGKLMEAELTAAEWRLWAYLVVLDPDKDLPDAPTIMEKARVGKTALYTAIAKLQKFGLYDFRNKSVGRNVGQHNINRIESQIRDRLKAELGGLTEVKTPVGRIDLLTETQIIEVKRVGDWKSALGQILAYSAFYPEHQKRLHLFGNAGDESKVSDIGNSCLAFDVLVSFELVVSEVEEEM